MLGFILRVTKSFQSVNNLQIRYFFLVRSVLWYNTAILTPFYLEYIGEIEMVQKKFMNIFNYRHNPTLLYVDYNIFLRKYEFIERKVFFSKIFLHKILNNYWLFLIQLYVSSYNVSSYRGRRYVLFFISRVLTLLHFNFIFLRVIGFHNWHLIDDDVLFINLQTFKKKLIEY